MAFRGVLVGRLQKGSRLLVLSDLVRFLMGRYDVPLVQLIEVLPVAVRGVPLVKLLVTVFFKWVGSWSGLVCGVRLAALVTAFISQKLASRPSAGRSTAPA